MNATELTVMVTTHNRAALLDEALASIADQHWADGSWDVVVVDNDSTDDTAAVLRRWRETMPVPMRVVEATEHHSPSYARNTGVRHTDARSGAFVDDDDDDIVGVGWVAAMGTALRDHELVGSRYDYKRLNPPDLAAANEFQTERLGHTYGAPEATGGGTGCRRELWNRIGGTDDDLRYGEDIDFSLRAAAAGSPAVFCPDAVYHFRLVEGARLAFRRSRHFGVASVGLYRRHGRGNGARPDPIGLLARVWVGYVLRLPALVSRRSRVVYAEQLGRRIGRLHGSWRERVWYP